MAIDMDTIDTKFTAFLAKIAADINHSVYRRDLIRAFIADGGTDTHRRYVHNSKVERMILGSEYSLEQKAKMFFVARAPVTDTEFLKQLEQDFLVKTNQKKIIGLYSKNEEKSIFEDLTQKRIRLSPTHSTPAPSTPTTSPPVKRAASEPVTLRPKLMKMEKTTSAEDYQKNSVDCQESIVAVVSQNDIDLVASEEIPTPEKPMVRPDPDTPELEILSVVSPTVVPGGRNPVIVNFLQRLHMTITGFQRHELGGLCQKIKEAIQRVGSSNIVLLMFQIMGFMDIFMGKLKGQRCVGSLNGEFFISQWDLVDILLERMEDCPSLEYFGEVLKKRRMELRRDEELIVSYLEVGEVFSNFVECVSNKA